MFLQETICIVLTAVFGLAFSFIGIIVAICHEKFETKERKNDIFGLYVGALSLASMMKILCVVAVIDIPLIVVVSIVYDSSSVAGTVRTAFDFITWNLVVGVILIRYCIYFRSVISKDLILHRWHIYITSDPDDKSVKLYRSASLKKGKTKKITCFELIFNKLVKWLYVVYLVLLLILVAFGLLMFNIYNSSYSTNYRNVERMVIAGLETFSLLICFICGCILYYHVRCKSLSFYNLSDKDGELLIKMARAQGITWIVSILLSLSKFLFVTGIQELIMPGIDTNLSNVMQLIIFVVVRYTIILCITYSFVLIPIQYLLSQPNVQLAKLDNSNPEEYTYLHNLGTKVISTSNLKLSTINFNAKIKSTHTMATNSKSLHQKMAGITFASIFGDKIGFELFMDYAHRDFSIEPLLFFIELTQIKYCFEKLRSRSQENFDHKQMITEILHVNENGLTGIPVSAPYGAGRVNKTIPDGVPVSKILFTKSALLDQMRKIFEKYIKYTGEFEINISYEVSEVLYVFFDDPVKFIDTRWSVKPEDVIVNVFDSAVLQILRLVHQGAWVRFLKSSKMVHQRLAKLNAAKNIINTIGSDNNNNKSGDSIERIAYNPQPQMKKSNTNYKFHLVPTVANQWTVHEIIGKGGFGIVHRGTNSYTNKDVALKFIIKNASKYHQQTALNEIKILKQLTRISHPNVIELNFQEYNYTYCTRDEQEFDTVLLVMEYASNGQLFDILRYSGPLNESIVRRYFHSIISALQCFHEQGIIHRDLKPQNILLDSEFNIKICDFGLSVVVENTNDDKDSKKQVGRVGTKGYMAPEILNGQPYDKSCDIFSTGVILYNLLTARSPFKEATIRDNKYKLLMTQSNPNGVCQAFWNLVNTDKEGKIKKDCLTDERVEHLIENMVKYNPNERITIDEIEQHDWYPVTDENKMVDDEQLRNVMIVKYKTSNAKKFRLLKSKKIKNDNIDSSDSKDMSIDGDDNINASTNANLQLVDQNRTLAEFESNLSQFGVSVADIKPVVSKAQVPLELVTIDENNEVAIDEKKLEHEQQQQESNKRSSFVLSLKRRVSASLGANNGSRIHLGGSDSVSKLSQYMSSQVTSETGLGSVWSMKCYTICNPLVVMVGIGDYHDALQNLIGMTKDYKNMIYTFNNKYGYAFYYQTKDNKMIYTKNNIIDLKSAHISEMIKIEWSEEEILQFIDCARDVAVSNKHDSVILIISSHGESDGVIFDSDFEEVQLLEIFYKFMRNECPYLQDKPKIVFVDACRGSLKSLVPTAQSQSQEQSQSEKQVLKGKNNNLKQTVNAKTNTKHVDHQAQNTTNLQDNTDTAESDETKGATVVYASVGSDSCVININTNDNDNTTSELTSEIKYDDTHNDQSKEQSKDQSNDQSKDKGADVKSNNDVKKSKLEEKLSSYHQEGNYRIIYANIEGYAVLEGGKRGGYLLQAVKKVFCDQNQIVNKNTHFGDIVLQINKQSQKLAGTKVVVQQVQDVNQMDGNIVFQTRKM